MTSFIAFSLQFQARIGDIYSMDKQANFDIIKVRFPDIYDRIINSASGDLVVIETKEGQSVPVVDKDGKRLYIHSRFDPIKEAERFIGEIEVGEFDLFVVFGFGFGYHIECLMKLMRRDSIVLIIEKSPLMLRLALEQRDLSSILKDSRLIILLDPSEDSIASATKGKSSRRSSLVLHRGSYQVEPDYYRNMQAIVRSYLSTKEVNIATLAKFERIWAGNIARNIDLYVRAPAAGFFFDKFKGVPAIIACAGPSLLNDLDFIRENRERALIIALDTSYKILIKHGIEPHFCLAVDPQVVNARYFEGTGHTETILVADPMVHPSVFRNFKGRAVIAGIAFDLLKWIETIAGEKGEITHGGSVSTNAYDFTRRIGASPIILVGQDLAFTGGYAHARGSYLDELIHLRTGRLYSAEMFNRFQLTALPRIVMRGMRSDTVWTNQKMMIFLAWFEKRKNPDLINATYDGAVIPGVRRLAAEDITLPSAERSISGEVMRLYRESNNEEELRRVRTRLRERISLILRELNEIVPSIDRAIGYSESLLSIVSKGGGKRDRIGDLLKRLSETDRLVESKKSAKDMISFSAQRVVHTITEGYEIDESDAGQSKEELIAKRSHYLYRGLLEGARFNIKILNKMLVLLG